MSMVPYTISRALTLNLWLSMLKMKLVSVYDERIVWTMPGRDQTHRKRSTLEQMVRINFAKQ